jgi:hypothetical protein
MPASCQSRKGLQQVMPEPHPSSLGNISQGMPLRSTKRMPLRQPRSGNRGLPPVGLGSGCGRRGSIRSYKPSGISSAAWQRTSTLYQPWSETVGGKSSLHREGAAVESNRVVVAYHYASGTSTATLRPPSVPEILKSPTEPAACHVPLTWLCRFPVRRS